MEASGRLPPPARLRGRVEHCAGGAMDSEARRNVAVGGMVTVILAAGGTALTMLVTNSANETEAVWPVLAAVTITALALLFLLGFWGWWPRWTGDDVTWQSRPAKHSLNRDSGRPEPEGLVVTLRALKPIQPTRLRVAFAESIEGAVTASFSRGSQLTRDFGAGTQTITRHQKAQTVECEVRRRRINICFTEPAFAILDLVEITLNKTPSPSQRVVSVRRRET